MALRKQQPKSFQPERHLSGLWVSYKKGKRKNPKLKTGEPVFHCHLSIVHCQFKNAANETLQHVYIYDITAMVRRPKIIPLSPLRGLGGHNPFGLLMPGISNLGNPEYAYFYTGKELIEDEALQYYDYGARMYDVQIGRWTSHDPVYQDASPYIFCGNDPINRIDPDGREWGVMDWVATVATGGLYAVGKLTYETFIKGSQFDHWLAKNEKEIVQGVFIGVSIGLAFTPLGPVAGIGLAMAMGGIQGGMYGGGFEGAMKGMVIGGLSAGFGAGAGMAVAGALGKTAASTFGGTLLTAAAGGFAGGFVGGAINAAENGGDIWRGALLGGAIGAGSAVVMAAGVYGVKRLIARQQGVAKLKAQGVKDVKADPLVKTDEELTEWTKKYNGDMYEKALEPEMKLSKREWIKYDGEEAWGLTEPDGSKITIARAATRSYIKLYMTTRHELYHSFFIRGDLNDTMYDERFYPKIRSDYELQHRFIREDFEQPFTLNNIIKGTYDSIFWSRPN